MEFEEPSCPICLNIWDNTLRTPRILPACGHTICTECLTKILLTQEPQCPMDSSKLPANGLDLGLFPTNFLAQQLLEERQYKELCQEHNEELRFVCMTVKCKICEDCMFDEKHKGHEVKPWKKIKQEVNKKKKDLKDLLGKLQSNHKALSKEINEKQKKLHSEVKERFESLEKLLILKKNYFFNEIEVMFKKEQEHLEGIMGTSSHAQKVLENQISNLTSYSNQDFFKAIKEDVSNFNFGFEQNLEKLSQEILLSTDAINQSCTNSLKEFEELVRSFELNNDFWRGKRFSVRNEPQVCGLNCLFDNFEVQSTLKLKNAGSSLTITNNSLDLKKLVLNEIELANIKEMEFKIIKCSLIPGDIQTLEYICKNIPKFKGLSVKFDPSKFTDKSFVDIFYLLFWRAQELEKIKLDFSDCKITDKDFAFLCERFPSQMPNLTTLDIELSSTQITYHGVKTLIKRIKPFMKNLVHFKLFVRYLNVTDDVAKKMFVPMPNVKSYQISFGGTQVTDETLKAFVENTLNTMESIESLELYFWEVQISEEIVMKLIRKLKNLKNLTMWFTGTNVTEQVITEFEKVALPEMKSLRELEIILDESGMFDSGKERLKKIKNMLSMRK